MQKMWKRSIQLNEAISILNIDRDHGTFQTNLIIIM